MIENKKNMTVQEKSNEAFPVDNKTMIHMPNDTIVGWERKAFAKGYRQAVKDVQEELMKHMHPMLHLNDYPSDAVPKATILSLDKLMEL